MWVANTFVIVVDRKCGVTVIWLSIKKEKRKEEPSFPNTNLKNKQTTTNHINLFTYMDM